jgi:hypothetical protein
MRLLIAYAFPGKEEAHALQKLVTESLKGPYKAYLTQVAVAVRSYTELQDFLYDPTTEFASPQAQSSFRALSMVIFIGEPNLLPWSQSTRQLYYLVKQCIKYSKPCFLAGCGMQMLSFLVSMGADRPRINVPSIDKRRGTGKPDPEDLKDLDEGEMYLDVTNGDLYRREDPSITDAGFTPSQNWRYYKNVGIHFVHTAENTAQGKLKRSGVNARNSTPMRFGSGRTSVALRSETTVMVNPWSFSHWLMKNMPRQFQVPVRHLWEVHEPPPKGLECLASSPRGPQVMEIGPLFAVQFLISSRFPDTCKIFTSWLLHVADSTNSWGATPLPECPDVLGLDVIVPVAQERDTASRSEASGANRAQSAGRTPTLFKVSGSDRGLKLVSPLGDNNAAQSVATSDRYGRGDTPGDWFGRGDTPGDWAEDVALPVAYKSFAKHEVRRMLHPELASGTPEDRMLVMPEAPIRVVRLPSAKKRPLCRWNQFKARDRVEGLEDLHMRNFVQATPSAPPVLHCFRPEDRSKWVGGDFYNCVGSNSRPSSRGSH